MARKPDPVRERDAVNPHARQIESALTRICFIFGTVWQ
jgi:hypothetical protein